MRRFTSDDDLRGAEFDRLDLSGARFRDVSLARARVRGADLSDADLDGMITGLRINGVEVEPLITAELDRRHPERALLSATDPDELRAGWAEFEAMWAATVERVRDLPPGTEDASVDDEWSFKQTLRHLVLATDAWLNLSILRRDQPFHRLGLLYWEAAGRTEELGLVPADATLSFDEVLAARDERVGMVRDQLAEITTARREGPDRPPLPLGDLQRRMGTPPLRRPRPRPDRATLRRLTVATRRWG
jgi:uncharacterized protein YjbI with pentapeptide repeats